MASAIKPLEPAQNAFLAQLETKSGRPNHFFRAMAHRPEVMERFAPLYAAIMGRGPVDRRLKELVYLTVAYANECPYCTAVHVAGAARAGVTAEEMTFLQTGQDLKFPEAERAAILYARELTQTADVEGTRHGLAGHYTDEQIVEITLVAAIANFTNRFNNGLQVQPEE